MSSGSPRVMRNPLEAPDGVDARHCGVGARRSARDGGERRLPVNFLELAKFMGGLFQSRQ